MPAGGAGEIIRTSSDKRARNYSANAIRACQQLAGGFTDFVEFLNRDLIFMRCDLEDTVRRCVNDQRPCMQMLLPVIMDDLGTRVGLVAQNLVAGLCRKSVQQLLWETFGECRQ